MNNVFFPQKNANLIVILPIEICKINTHTLKFNSCLEAVLFHSKNINYAPLRKKKTNVPFKNSFFLYITKITIK